MHYLRLSIFSVQSLLAILLCTVILSCSEADDSIGETIQPIENGDIEIEILETAIDTSDLFYLPDDTGGVHEAFPLGSTEAPYGHYVYTPGGYTSDGPKYPLLLFMHGWGERGDSRKDSSALDNVLVFGPPRLIKQNNWNPTHPFIVVSPQLVTQFWRSSDVHKFLEFIINQYQINTDRIYLTGLSLGGGGCWFYVGEMGEESHAAAIVPISASGAEYIVDNLSRVPIWAFHGSDDQVVDPYNNFGSVPLVNAINQKNPEVKAKVTVFLQTGHNAWTRTYNNIYTYPRFYSYDQFNTSIYDWLLQYRKDD